MSLQAVAGPPGDPVYRWSLGIGALIISALGRGGGTRPEVPEVPVAVGRSRHGGGGGGGKL